MRPKGTLRGSKSASTLPPGTQQLRLFEDSPQLRRCPCDVCPLNKPTHPKILPILPSGHIEFGVVGLGPYHEEERQNTPFVGEGGVMLRREMRAIGLPIPPSTDPRQESRVAVANLTRCMPDDGFGSESWKAGAELCWEYLSVDLHGSYPLLLLGGEPLRMFLRDKGASVTRQRGMWYRTPEGRFVFPTWHPAGIMRQVNETGQAKRLIQFRKDLKRFADKVLGREQLPPIQIDIFPTLAEAKTFLEYLARSKSRWIFDIETFDNLNVPGRKYVATDPFHPEFRVRGVAIAWRGDRGAWIELAPWEHRKDEARAILSPAFMSMTPKGAFHGHFDEAGLVYPGWVHKVENRSSDGLLALIAINAGGQEGKSLERAVVEILGEPQYWSVDKTRMKDLPIAQVAEGSVRDACSTLKLVDVLEEKLKAGDYLIPDEEEGEDDAGF